MTASTDDGSRSSSAWRESAQVDGGLRPGLPPQRREVVAHPADPNEPRANDGCILLDFADADLRAEMQISNFGDQRRREGEPLVREDVVVAMLLQRFEQHQGLVERQRD